MKEGTRGKVYNINAENRQVKASLQVGKKKPDGEWENQWHNIRFVGKCVDKAKTLAKGDAITINSAAYSATPYSKNDGKKATFFEIICFDFERTEKKQASGEHQPDNSGFDPEDDGELPF